jgi:hypothetical protein
MMTAPCESSPPVPNHNDAASALMALAGTADSNNPTDCAAKSDVSMDNNTQKVQVDAASPPHSPNTQNSAAAAASRFPDKVSTRIWD